MDIGIGLAPQAPALLGTKIGDPARQMVGRIALIEPSAQGGIGDDRAHDENGLHRPGPPVGVTAAGCRACAPASRHACCAAWRARGTCAAAWRLCHNSNALV